MKFQNFTNKLCLSHYFSLFYLKITLSLNRLPRPSTHPPTPLERGQCATAVKGLLMFTISATSQNIWSVKNSLYKQFKMIHKHENFKQCIKILFFVIEPVIASNLISHYKKKLYGLILFFCFVIANMSFKGTVDVISSNHPCIKWLHMSNFK